MDKACGEDGFGSVDVLGVVDQNGMQVEEVLHGGVAGLLLAEDSESAADGCPHTHQVLQASDGEAIDPVQWEAVTCGGLFQLLGGDFACLQQAQNLISCFLDGGVEGGDPVLDIRVVPAVWDVILEGWVWRVQDVRQDRWLGRWWSGWMGWGGWSRCVAGALHGSEGFAQVVELLFCAGQLIRGVLKGS